ncbi:hypothetical protein GCM10027028_24130 [Streptomyces sundarbansensis]
MQPGHFGPAGEAVRLNGKGKQQGAVYRPPRSPERGRQEQASKTTWGATAPHCHSRKALFLACFRRRYRRSASL